MKADLHLHTTHSDGLRTSREVIDLAASHGIDVVAISDHDHVAAYFEVRQHAQKKGLRLVPAVELSTSFDGQDIHLLGYDFDPASTVIEDALQRFRDRRQNRGALMVEKLIENGYAITLDRVREISDGGSLGRPHIARALIEGGYVFNMDEAFDSLLSPGRPGYVDVERITTTDAIALVHEAGGFASVAHPALYTQHRAIVDQLLEFGLDGIEVFHPDVDEANASYYLRIAMKRNLIVTGGSDDHGFEGAKTMGRVMLREPFVQAFVDRLRH